MSSEEQVKRPNYLAEADGIKDFLRNFPDRKYHLYLQEVADRKRKRIPIELDDIAKFFRNLTLCIKIEDNTLRFKSLFEDAIEDVIQSLPKSRKPVTDTDYDYQDVHDLFTEHLIQRNKQYEEALKIMEAQKKAEESTMTESFASPVKEEKKETVQKSSIDSAKLPKQLIRRYEVNFIARTSAKPTPLRQIRAKHLGKLVSVRGIVTRSTDVKAELRVATYACDKCGYEVYQEITSRLYMPLAKCPSSQCKTAKQNGNLQLLNRGSKFVKFQEISLQEMTDEVPTGSIPRALKVCIHGEITRSCTPGDQITLSGIFLPSPLTGGKSGSRHGPVSTTYVEAMDITRHKKRYDDYMVNESIKTRIEEEFKKPDVYTRLARSIAPEIYGHEDVKKALLLMLVGGVTKNIKAGVKIRGDINICLMGDPGVAKSQLLRYIAALSPRGIYTSGKGSSGVGLTAAVIKDPLTSELILEGGALVLADNGICCIDEFDKMDEYDRTALHEVMEQQSISIAKAGITTTLNARSSVLAAANPAYGRYNPRKSPTENINLPPALLSRFDILFLLLDKQDDDLDSQLARHVGYVHQHNKAPERLDNTEYFDPNFIRAYVAYAKQKEPEIKDEKTMKSIAEMYVQMRSDDHRNTGDDQNSNYTTPRTLLGILRLSQALARLRFSDNIEESDVAEAKRIMEVSKISLLADDKRKKTTQDPKSQVYDIIRGMSKAVIAIADIKRAALSKGLRESEVNDCLEDYQQMGVWVIEQDTIHIVDA